MYFGENLTRYSSYDSYKYNQNKGHHLLKRSFNFDGIDLYGWHIHIENDVLALWFGTRTKLPLQIHLNLVWYFLRERGYLTLKPPLVLTWGFVCVWLFWRNSMQLVQLLQIWNIESKNPNQYQLNSYPWSILNIPQHFKYVHSSCKSICKCVLY